MTFRIRHEETNVKIISFVSCTVSDRTITVRHLLRKQQIALDTIGNIQIERYQRHRRRTHSGVHYFIQPETDRPDRYGNNRRKRLVRPHGSDAGRQCAALSGVSVHPVGAEPDACLLSPS
ncbi:MAG: hypothetical protein IKI77_01050 [Oscillospiraceae bacterium]|nr:hypothetical protein [Oscillospiraceae bacterium]